MRRDIYVVSNDEQREAVLAVQRTLMVEMTGQLDPPTRERLRGVQALFGLPITGILDMATNQKISEVRSQHG